MWFGNAQAQVCLGWSCTGPAHAGTFTPEAAPAELPAWSTNKAAFGTAAALGPVNAPSHIAHPPQIVSEQLSETLSKRTAKETTGVTLNPWNTEFIHFYQH